MLGSDGALAPMDQIKYAYNYAYEHFKNSYFVNISEQKVREIFERNCEIHWGITDHNTVGAFEELASQHIVLPKNFHLHVGVEFEVYCYL